MKLKFVLIGLAMLGSVGCVTSTNSYTRDIVYRDGSYYSPADEQYGDYYYEPEPDYSYYQDYPYFGYSSGFYGNYWYGRHDAYNCRFSYRYDRYCDNGWSNFYLGFGSLTLIFGNSGHYGYGYPYYGYDHYPYYGHHSPRPRPDRNDPIPTPKPRPPFNHRPPPNVDGNPIGVRVPGEPIHGPIQMITKPGLIEETSPEPAVEPGRRNDRNPYTRTRQQRESVRPEIWRHSSDDAQEGIVIRQGRRPAPDNREQPLPDRQTRPYPVIDTGSVERQQRPIRAERGQPVPPADAGAVNASSNRQVPVQRQQAAPRERSERVERVTRSERSFSETRSESKKEGSDDR